MDKWAVIARLREFEPAEFDGSKRLSLLDLVRVENRPADILGVPVDLASARAPKDGVPERATREAVLAF